MRIPTINFNFLKDWELSADFVSHVVFNICVAARLLVIELVAREGQYFKTPISELLVHLHKLVEVHLGHASF